MSVNAATTIDAENKNTTQPAGVLLNKFSLIGLAILIILAAWAGQTVIVILLGLALSAAGLSKLWSHYSLKSVYCDRQLSENRVFPDEDIELKIRLVNRKLLPLPWIQVHDEVPSKFAPDLPPGIKPGFGLISHSTSIMWYSAINWKYRLHCSQRGYYSLGPLTVSSGDIFGFYPCTAIESEVDHVIVYPRIFTLSQLSIPSLYPVGEAKSEKRIFEDPSRTIGIRDYSPGDSLRRIHWKASARHQQLQVKVFEPSTTLKAGVFLAVDSFQNSGVWNETGLELGISTVASLANYLIEKNSQVGLWANTRLADSGESARISPGSGVTQLMQILETLAKVVMNSSGSFTEYFHDQRKAIPLGTTLIFVLAQIPARFKGILADLKESGYKLMVFQIGDGQDEDSMTDIPCFKIREPGETAKILAEQH
jgi:uncharacterized protein (DUF58 family)